MKAIIVFKAADLMTETVEEEDLRKRLDALKIMGNKVICVIHFKLSFTVQQIETPQEEERHGA